MGQGLRLALAGIVLGCALAYGLAQLLRGMLFAVAPADPVVFLAVPLALIADRRRGHRHPRVPGDPSGPPIEISD